MEVALRDLLPRGAAFLLGMVAALAVCAADAVSGAGRLGNHSHKECTIHPSDLIAREASGEKILQHLNHLVFRLLELLYIVHKIFVMNRG